MFGYVRPVKSELLVKEYEFYRAVYCGICRAMKKHTGALSNVALSYDSVFLALVRMLYVEDGEIGVERRRCIAHPMKKRPMLRENTAIEYTARAFAILSYYKLADDLQDEGGLKKLAVITARPLLSYARSRAECPELCATAARLLAEIKGLEDAECQSVDRPASLFGELLGEIFAFGLGEKDRPVPYQVGYHLGRFIYAADAAEDYEADAREGKYNPYVLSYGKDGLTDGNKETVRCGLLLECRKLESAVNLLPYGNRATVENIINNIIYLGLVKRIEFLKTDTDGKKSEIKEKEL